MNERLHIHKKASSAVSFPRLNQFQSRPYVVQAQPASNKPDIEEEIENQEFQQQELETLGLERQAGQGRVKPQGQERLVLQAKGTQYWQQRRDYAKREGDNVFKHLQPQNPASAKTAPLVQPKLNLQKVEKSSQETFIDQKTGVSLRMQALSRSSLSMSKPLVQTKLTIGEPGDKYEQEADRVAASVVNSLQAPTFQQAEPNQALQRQQEPSEEIQVKPSISGLEQSPLPTQVQLEAKPEEEELQAKPILQSQSAIGGGEASTDVESAINSAKGGGQHLEAGLQRSMGSAMGADFSRVKVHTDAQADQLNQSIQARAFTTGQNVFFRSGEYNPGSRGGQELIAHELTHVVQQNSGAVQRSPLAQVTGLLHSPAYIASGNGTHDIQRVEEASEYAHIVIDKEAKGLTEIRDSLNKNGLQTAATMKINLSEGSKKLGHDRHVFMWDDTDKGRKGAASLVKPESTVTVKIRKKGLTIGGWFTVGNLKVDNMNELGKGKPTGAWAYSGDIERKYIFIDGIDKESDPGYEDWKNGEGWPEDKFTNAVKGARAISEARMRQGRRQ